MIAQEVAYLIPHRVVSLTLESTYAAFNGLPLSGYMNMVVPKKPPAKKQPTSAATESSSSPSSSVASSPEGEQQDASRWESESPSERQKIEDFCKNVVENLLFPKEWLDSKTTEKCMEGFKTNREFMMDVSDFVSYYHFVCIFCLLI
jgi:hypothetical protein